MKLDAKVIDQFDIDPEFLEFDEKEIFGVFRDIQLPVENIKDLDTRKKYKEFLNAAT